MKSKMFLSVAGHVRAWQPRFSRRMLTPARAPRSPSPRVSRWPLLPAFAPLRRAVRSASSAEAIARNPGAGNVIRGALILGLAFIESLALFTFVVIAAKF